MTDSSNQPENDSRIAVAVLWDAFQDGGGILLDSGLFAMLLPLIGQEFTPKSDEGQFQVQVEAPVGSAIQQTSKIAREVEETVATLPAVKDIYTTVGGQYEGQTTVAQVMVRMADKDDRRVSQDEVMQMARERLARFSHMRMSVDAVARLGGGGFRSAPIQYNLRGDSLEELDAVAAKVVARMKQTPGFVDVNTTSQSGKPELSIDIDRDRASDLAGSQQTPRYRRGDRDPRRTGVCASTTFGLTSKWAIPFD